nr:uncharacterized protein LOC109185693 [Ipomoea trifida]
MTVFRATWLRAWTVAAWYFEVPGPQAHMDFPTDDINSVGSHQWFPDMGPTNHATFDPFMMSSIAHCDGPGTLRVGNGIVNAQNKSAQNQKTPFSTTASSSPRRHTSSSHVIRFFFDQNTVTPPRRPPGDGVATSHAVDSKSAAHAIAAAAAFEERCCRRRV